MSEPAYVAVDWGTSSFRLWLIDRAGRIVVERRSDEGMLASAKAGFAAVLQSHLLAVGAADDLPVLICGMAGARQGWVEAGYVDTPARLAAILEQAALVPGQSRDIRILPGIAQRDATAPDVMRGEETQLLGSLGVDAADDVTVSLLQTDPLPLNGIRLLQREVREFPGELRYLPTMPACPIQPVRKLCDSLSRQHSQATPLLA